jgi:uncharacterized protein
MTHPHTAHGGGRRDRRALTVNAHELLREVGTTRTIDVDVPLEDLGIDDPRLHGDVAVHVVLDSTFDRLLARGEFSAEYRDTCSRCLAPIERRLVVTADEQYRDEPPPDDPDHEDFLDSFPIEHGQIDLAPMVRESLLLGMPDAPQCRDDCRGLCPVCGTDLNSATCLCDTTVRDERWAVLDQLRDV